jgi:hypothetical protein
MICDNLKNWPQKHSQKHSTKKGQNLQDTPCTISRRDSLCPHTKPRTFCLLVEKHLKVFTKSSSLFFFIFHVKETEKPSTSQPDRLTLSHSDHPLFLLPYYFNTEKKQSLPSTPQHNFLKGTLLSPTQNPRVPI